MGTLGNIPILTKFISSSCPHAVVFWRHRCYYGMFAVHKLSFLAPKFRLRRVQKNGKKEQKMKNRVLQKTLFYFSVFTSWTLFWGLIRVEKIVWGRCARQKIFFDFSLPVKVRNFGKFLITEFLSCGNLNLNFDMIPSYICNFKNVEKPLIMYAQKYIIFKKNSCMFETYCIWI